jgi:hypothetical protein
MTVMNRSVSATDSACPASPSRGDRRQRRETPVEAVRNRARQIPSRSARLLGQAIEQGRALVGLGG